MIDYDQFEMAQLENMDYCTATIPELMDKLAIPLFFVLMKEISIDEGIHIIKNEILNEKNSL